MVNLQNIETKFIPTSDKVRVFSYTGSKFKYQSSFNDIHTNIGVKQVKQYIEVFSGSLASMFHNLQHIEVTDRIIINDINEKLINLYRNIQSNPNELFEKYNSLEEQFNSTIPKDIEGIRVIPTSDRDKFELNRKFYYDCRNLLNSTGLNIYNASLLLFILNHNFNGLYSENKKGEVNVSINWSSKKVDTLKIKNSIMNLHGFFNENTIVFETLSSHELIEKYNERDTFIYLDPPYSDSCIQYTSNNEESFNNVSTHRKMLESCKKFNYVLYSNNNVEELHSMFDITHNFSRSGTLQTKKAKLEMLSFKSNVVQYISPSDILGITLPQNTTPANNSKFADVKNKKVIPTAKSINSTDLNAISFISTFNGVGSFSESLEQLNIKIKEKIICEIDSKPNETYYNNFHKDTHIDDINELLRTIKPGKKVDVLVQSPPCQSFSMSGSRQGFLSENGNLFLTAIKLQNKIDSSITIYENVLGLCSHNKNYLECDKTGVIKNKDEVVGKFDSLINNGKEIGGTLHIIEKELLKDTRYNYYWKIISPNQLGYPQNRKRIIIIGIKKELDTNKSFQFPKHKDLLFTVEDILEPNVKTGIYSNPRKSPILKSNQEKRPSKIHKYGEYTKIPYSQSKRICFPYVSPCIMTREGNKFFIDGVVRNLTPTELKRVHGFREEFTFPEKSTKGSKQKQMGNTISPVVFIEIMKELQKYLNINVLNNVNFDNNQIDIDSSSLELVS